MEPKAIDREATKTGRRVRKKAQGWEYGQPVGETPAEGPGGRRSGKNKDGPPVCRTGFHARVGFCMGFSPLGNLRIKKKTRYPLRDNGFRGAAGRIRTADLILTKDALYLLSYSSMVAACAALFKKAVALLPTVAMTIYKGLLFFYWRPRTGSNRRPPA